MPELCRILEFPIFIIGAILSAIMGAAWILGELDFGLFTNAAFERLFATPSFLAFSSWACSSAAQLASLT